MLKNTQYVLMSLILCGFVSSSYAGWSVHKSSTKCVNGVCAKKTVNKGCVNGHCGKSVKTRTW